jgi:hypothetical protein
MVDYSNYGEPVSAYMPRSCHYLLGDNRKNSYDSHAWPTPWLPRSAIIGKVVFPRR